jgi:hypothetical protein
MPDHDPSSYHHNFFTLLQEITTGFRKSKLTAHSQWFKSTILISMFCVTNSILDLRICHDKPKNWKWEILVDQAFVGLFRHWFWLRALVNPQWQKGTQCTKCKKCKKKQTEWNSGLNGLNVGRLDIRLIAFYMWDIGSYFSTCFEDMEPFLTVNY